MASSRRTNPADAANMAVRSYLCDISETLGGFNSQDEDNTRQFFDGKCPYTSKPLPSKVSYDHLIPHNREHCGLHLYGNILLVSQDVNQAKGRKDYKEFLMHNTTVVKGNDAERKSRIDKIEQFREESRYESKVPKGIEEQCKALYQKVRDLCRYNGVNNAAEITETVAEEERELQLTAVIDSGALDILPIFLEPKDAEQFKSELLKHRKAVIRISYSDGTTKDKRWKANGFSERSNVINNLRSRHEFRQDKWQKQNITRVDVYIKDN